MMPFVSPVLLVVLALSVLLAIGGFVHHYRAEGWEGVRWFAKVVGLVLLAFGVFLTVVIGGMIAVTGGH